jgi:hypothetical protein
MAPVSQVALVKVDGEESSDSAFYVVSFLYDSNDVSQSAGVVCASVGRVHARDV